MLTVDFSNLSIKPGTKILDLGCGEGRHLHNVYLRDSVTAVGLDLDFDSLKKTNETCKKYFPMGNNKDKNWLLLQGRCEILPFKREIFDIVICSEVLEHIENYHGVIKEIWSVLTPNGHLVVSVPRYLPERICWALCDDYKYEKGGHIRIFKVSPLVIEIERLGFKLYKKHHAHGLHSPYWWLKCLNWQKRDTWFPIKLYYKLLVLDIIKKPKFTRFLDKILSPIIGKSVVLYFKKVGKKW